jgi:hypothetical protein
MTPPVTRTFPIGPVSIVKVNPTDKIAIVVKDEANAPVSAPYTISSQNYTITVVTADVEIWDALDEFEDLVDKVKDGGTTMDYSKCDWSDVEAVSTKLATAQTTTALNDEDLIDGLIADLQDFVKAKFEADLVAPVVSGGQHSWEWVDTVTDSEKSDALNIRYYEFTRIGGTWFGETVTGGTLMVGYIASTLLDTTNTPASTKLPLNIPAGWEILDAGTTAAGYIVTNVDVSGETDFGAVELEIRFAIGDDDDDAVTIVLKVVPFVRFKMDYTGTLGDFYTEYPLPNGSTANSALRPDVLECPYSDLAFKIYSEAAMDLGIDDDDGNSFVHGVDFWDVSDSGYPLGPAGDDGEGKEFEFTITDSCVYKVSAEEL